MNLTEISMSKEHAFEILSWKYDIRPMTSIWEIRICEGTSIYNEFS